MWQYAPYGGKWLQYFYRRVRERKENVTFALRAVDAFPMTVTGKVQKFLIREQMTAELRQDASTPHLA